MLKSTQSGSISAQSSLQLLNLDHIKILFFQTSCRVFPYLSKKSSHASKFLILQKIFRVKVRKHYLKSAQNCPNCGMCSFILKNCPKSIQLQKLQKFTKNRDFTFFQLLFVVQVNKVLRHDLTVWIFNPIILHMPFLLSKIGLCS